jgi:hypothetical protein
MSTKRKHADTVDYGLDIAPQFVRNQGLPQNVFESETRGPEFLKGRELIRIQPGSKAIKDNLPLPKRSFEARIETVEKVAEELPRRPRSVATDKSLQLTYHSAKILETLLRNAFQILPDNTHAPLTRFRRRLQPLFNLMRDKFPELRDMPLSKRETDGLLKYRPLYYSEFTYYLFHELKIPEDLLRALDDVEVQQGSHLGIDYRHPVEFRTKDSAFDKHDPTLPLPQPPQPRPPPVSMKGIAGRKKTDADRTRDQVDFQQDLPLQVVFEPRRSARVQGQTKVAPQPQPQVQPQVQPQKRVGGRKGRRGRRVPPPVVQGPPWAPMPHVTLPNGRVRGREIQIPQEYDVPPHEKTPWPYKDQVPQEGFLLNRSEQDAQLSKKVFEMYDETDPNQPHRLMIRDYLSKERCRAGATTHAGRCENFCVIGIEYCWYHLLHLFHLRIEKSPIGGVGLFAALPDDPDPQKIVFRQGDNVMTYKGEVVHTAEMQRRYGPHTAPYAFSPFRHHPNFTLDSAHRRSIGSLINHANGRNDNVELTLLHFSHPEYDRMTTVGIKALKAVRNGQELFANYGRDYRLDDPSTKITRQLKHYPLQRPGRNTAILQPGYVRPQRVHRGPVPPGLHLRARGVPFDYQMDQ